MPILLDEHWGVDASGSVQVALPASTVWGQMRDLRRFVTRDPLHVRVDLLSTRLEPGAEMVILHRLLGIGVTRRSRLLRWEEGRGYAFSDLSLRGKTVGFPHVCSYDLREIDAEHAEVTFAARGRWTATWMPRWLVRLWLHWVIRDTTARIGHELHAYRKFLERRGLIASVGRTAATNKRRVTPSRIRTAS